MSVEGVCKDYELDIMSLQACRTADLQTGETTVRSYRLSLSLFFGLDIDRHRNSGAINQNAPAPGERITHHVVIDRVVERVRPRNL